MAQAVSERAATRRGSVVSAALPSTEFPANEDEFTALLETMREHIREVELPLKVELLIDALGSASALADILGVSKSQPTRWRKGEERPSPEAKRFLLDLEHVISRAGQLYQKPVVLDWLRGSNVHLDGARPIDVLRLRGSTPVIDALDAELQGAY